MSIHRAAVQIIVVPDSELTDDYYNSHGDHEKPVLLGRSFVDEVGSIYHQLKLDELDADLPYAIAHALTVERHIIGFDPRDIDWALCQLELEGRIDDVARA